MAEDRALTAECVAVLDRSWTEPAEREHIAIFRNRALDLLLTRSHPILAVALAAPIAIAGVAVSFADEFVPSLVAFVAGILVWTLVEYAMHRFFFHLPRTSHALRVVSFLVHGHHHVYPLDAKRLAATPLQMIGMLLLVQGLLWLFTGDLWVACFSGIVTGYALYEGIHWFAHHGKARTALGRAIKRHHLSHHYENPDARWGISSPLWDYVFRTMEPQSSKSDSSP